MLPVRDHTLSSPGVCGEDYIETSHLMEEVNSLALKKCSRITDYKKISTQDGGESGKSVQQICVLIYSISSRCKLSITSEEKTLLADVLEFFPHIVYLMF